MPNLTSEVWSESAVEELRRYEQHCPDNELFFIGYLIPLVERVELEWQGETQDETVWCQRYQDYVNQCLEEDSVSEVDSLAIISLAQKLMS
jgi:hypothetical protein